MKDTKISFAIKNTNWCNLKCAHCSECSAPDIAPNIMPLHRVEKYIGEFNAMPIPRWKYMVFTGGEAMAPYFHNMPEYIPTCLDVAASYRMAPFVKTNGLWGADDNMRWKILHDFARVAYRREILMSMDISVDEFHNNLTAVNKIINDVVRSDYLAPAVRLSLVGLNTHKSRLQFSQLLNGLYAAGLYVRPDVCMVKLGVPGVRDVKVFHDFFTNVSNVGRAKENNLGKYVPDGQPDIITGHCMQIDNNDIATLNYKYKTPVAGRPIYDVAKELLLKVR